MTPCAGESGPAPDVDYCALMFAVTAKTFEVAIGADRQPLACHQPDVDLAHIEIAMWIDRAEITVATDASVVGRSAPGTVTRRAIADELLVSLKQGPRLKARAQFEHCHLQRDQHARNGEREYGLSHTPAKYSTART